MQQVLWLSGVVLTAFWLMEFAAWFTHKYVMHGALWVLHRDHHRKPPGFFEKNDAFFLIFAIPSWLCIMLGMMYGSATSVAFGAGIALYGLTYFLVHEIFIHQRFRFLRDSQWLYFKALRRAHKMHHKHLDQHPGENYGMLVFPWKYVEEERKQRPGQIL
jgi:beta-carotene 3-hydroxylase